MTIALRGQASGELGCPALDATELSASRRARIDDHRMTHARTLAYAPDSRPVALAWRVAWTYPLGRHGASDFERQDTRLTR